MSAENTVLQPGVSIKPQVTENDVTDIINEVYGLKCVSIKVLNGYDDNNYHVKVDERCENNYIESINKDGYTLKVVNSLDSQKPHFFEAQNELLLYLCKNGICCPKPVKNKNGEYYIIKTYSSGTHIVRLLEYVSGSILPQVPCSSDLFYQCGRYVAQLDEALKNFHHSAYDAHKTVWQLESVPQLSQFLYAIKNEARKKIVESVIEEFSEKVLTVSQRLEKGVIHGDFNEQNILVDQKDNKWFIKGVLDFGDSHYSCYLYELAIAMTYLMIQGRSIDTGGYVLAGYSSVRKLPVEEFNLLRICILARICQSLVLGAYSSLQDPNNSYILTTSKPGWVLLEELWTYPEDKLLQHWKSFVDR